MTLVEFFHLDNAAVERKIVELSPKELYKLHVHVCRSAVRGKVATGATVIEAPFTFGFSLLVMPIGARRWSVSNTKKEIIEKEIKKRDMTGYSVTLTDYVLPAAITTATFGAAVGLEPVIEQGLEFVGDVVRDFVGGVFDFVGGQGDGAAAAAADGTTGPCDHTKKLSKVVVHEVLDHNVHSTVHAMESLRGHEKAPQNGASYSVCGSELIGARVDIRRRGSAYS